MIKLTILRNGVCTCTVVIVAFLRFALWWRYYGSRGEKMSEILISVIIPAYNCAGFIHLALDSALAQDVPMEILVINDCSMDNLDQVMEKYQDLSQIHYLKNEKNMGVAATRNKGIALAKGEYIAFLDSDDYWEKDKLKKQLERLEETKTVICSTARELMNPNGTLTGYVIPVKPEFTFRDLRLQNFINCSSVLMRADVAKEFPMHHDDGHEDYLMWMEVLKKYEKGCAVNEPLLKYRVSNTGKSGHKLKSAKMTFRTYRYMGFGLVQSMIYFFCNVFYGMKKYIPWYLKRFRGNGKTV